MIALLSCHIISCKKDGTLKPYLFVSVKFIEDEGYIFIEITARGWDNTQKIAMLNATGYRNERLGLHLPYLIDTGNYPNPTIRNVSFTGGIELLPFKVNVGYIYFNYINTLAESDLFMSVSGKIMETNKRLLQKPTMINSDPYGEGWMVRIEITNLPESTNFLDATSYNQLTGE